MRRFRSTVACLVVCAAIALLPPVTNATLTDASDGLWDDAWPYRSPVTVSGS